MTKSKLFSCFETKLTQAVKKWKYQAPFLVLRNTETKDYIGKKNEMDWNMKKIDLLQTFQLFRYISKQNWNKLWKRVKKPGPISGVSKHWNNVLYREIF